MVRLVDDVMEVSRINRGTLALRLKATDTVAVALVAGFDRHYTKPLDPAVLLRCLNQWRTDAGLAVGP